MAKVYEYEGKLYSEDYWTDAEKDYAGDLSDLLYLLSKDHPEIYREEKLTFRYIDNECFGTDEEKTDADTIENIIWQGYEEISEVKE